MSGSPLLPSPRTQPPDDAFKVRAYNPDSRTHRATFLGPTHGGPIVRLQAFRSVASGVCAVQGCSSAAAWCTPEACAPPSLNCHPQQPPPRSPRAGNSWLAYSTADRVVGLIAWPLVGDPELSMGVIAHPGRVLGVAVTHDGRKLLTAGEGGVVNVWEIDTSSLEAHATALSAATARASAAAAASLAADSAPDASVDSAGALSGTDVSATGADAARWEVLAGDEALVEELRDLFTYVELLETEARAAAASAGTLGGCCSASGAAKMLTGRVPASALPDLMRAAGYYPSNAEIAALMSHVRFLSGLHGEGSAVDNGESAQGAQGEWVDFGTFLALLVNHRPLVGITQADIESAFAALGASATVAGALNGQALLEALQQGGERMSAAELQHILQVLTGSADPADAVPQMVTPLSFASDVLGFGSAASEAADESAGVAMVAAGEV